MQPIKIFVDEQGAVSMIYTDDFPIIDGFSREITRLSNVEPNVNGLWQVHFLHESEPRAPEFVRREDALDYEKTEAEKMLAKGEI